MPGINGFDSTGAAVPNAQVSVTSAERGETRAATTNNSGDYLFPALPVGHYDVSITAKGFKTYQAKGVVLNVGEKARNDVRLEVGAEQTQVTVEGTALAQVETQSSDLSSTVTGKEISELQLNGRNFTQFVNLTPGVSNQTGQDEGTAVSTATSVMPLTAGVSSTTIGNSMAATTWTTEATIH